MPGAASQWVPVPGGTGFYGIGYCDCQYGEISVISPPSAPGRAWTQTAIYTFTGMPDGSLPGGNLILNADGSLYGVTAGGGQYNYGAVYQLIPPPSPGGAWTDNILYSFAGAPSDGREPQALTIGSDGSLYGPTGSGGNQNLGTVFHLTPPSTPGAPWQESIVYAFGSELDGEFANDVILSPSGELYGITSNALPALSRF